MIRFKIEINLSDKPKSRQYKSKNSNTRNFAIAELLKYRSIEITIPISKIQTRQIDE